MKKVVSRRALYLWSEIGFFLPYINIVEKRMILDRLEKLCAKAEMRIAFCTKKVLLYAKFFDPNIHFEKNQKNFFKNA